MYSKQMNGEKPVAGLCCRELRIKLLSDNVHEKVCNSVATSWTLNAFRRATGEGWQADADVAGGDARDPSRRPGIKALALCRNVMLIQYSYFSESRNS